IDPALFRAYFARGLCFYRKGEYERALEDFSAAILLRSDFLRGYVFRVLTYKALGKHEEAEKDRAYLEERGFPWRGFLETEEKAVGGYLGEEMGVLEFLESALP
ncbi:MAG: tetratricopeptide repeat protein, partial [Candidatus Caldatribacterium sp.]|nr:tetratricopeptide repeat protein [Candidatus Caldatribacterium sp.]